jgi:3-hydroxy-5-methyl-1-naphthoate 3-O-methyltransferase
MTGAPTPAPLFELVSGLWAAKTLVAAVQLDVFSPLAGGRTTTAAQFAARHGIEERPAGILLTACAGLGLLSVTGGAYANTPVAEAFLVKGAPAYFGDYVEAMNTRNYPGWDRVLTAIRENRPTSWDPTGDRDMFVPEDPAAGATFWDGMHAISRFTAGRLADTGLLSGVRSLLDVGGGGGAYVLELSHRHPRLAAAVYDLPFVCDQTAKRVAAEGLGGRIAFHPGDFFADDLPRGYDALLLSSILRDWCPEQNLALLAKCFDALPSGGLLLVCELLVDDDNSGPRPAALMGMVMLIGTWGRAYTGAEYRSWLTRTGFTQISTVPLDAPGANAVVTARKP